MEYKDKLDEEWEMFQRAIKEENHVSNQNCVAFLKERFVTQSNFHFLSFGEMSKKLP